MTSTQMKTAGMVLTILVVSGIVIINHIARQAAYDRAREQSNRNICRNNLRVIDGAKDQFGLERNLQTGAVVSGEDLSPYIRYGFSRLTCPKGGRYTVNPIGSDAECSEHGSITAERTGPSPAPEAQTQVAAAAAAAEAARLEQERQAKLAADAEAARLEQARQAKLAADAEAARLEQERQAKLAADAEAARLAAQRSAPAEAPPAATTPAAKPPEFKLSGIMGGKGNYAAVINNQIHETGDRLGAGTIRSIEATEVTVENPDGTTFTLRVGAPGATGVTPTDGSILPRELRKGLVAYYPFNRNDGGRVRDHSEARRSATAIKTVWISRGKVGGAMRFTPKGSRITASDEGLPMGDAPRSVAFWVQLGQGNDVLPALLTYGRPSPGQQCGLGMDWRAGRSSINVSPSGSCNVASRRLEYDRWYHVVYCYGGGGEHAFFINGVRDPVGVQEFTTFSTQLGGTLWLGDTDDQPPSFDGCLDEVMIYDRVLTPADVRQIYERQ